MNPTNRELAYELTRRLFRFGYGGVQPSDEVLHGRSEPDFVAETIERIIGELRTDPGEDTP